MLPATGRGSSSSAKEAATLSKVWGGREAEGGGEGPRCPSPPLELPKGATHRFRQLALSSKASRSLGLAALQTMREAAAPTAAAAPAEAEAGAEADGERHGESGEGDEGGEGSGEPVPRSPAARPYSATNGADPQPPPGPPTAPATGPAVAGKRAPMPSAVEQPRGVPIERASGEGPVSFVGSSYWSQGEQHAISVLAGALEELGVCQRVVRAGGGFGAPALLHGTPRDRTALTLAPHTQLVVVPKRQYDKLVRAVVGRAVARKIGLVRGVLPAESLARWSDVQLQKLAYAFGEQGGNLERPPRGERLQRVGEPPSHVWLVVSGEVCVLQHLAADDGGAGGAAAMVQVAAYGPGALVGELSPSGGACSAALVVGSSG